MALNAEQEAAAACHLHDSRTSVLIVGGPGSGKTHTLVHRAARLLRAADPARVLLLTFTRAAAAAMTERIERLLPGGVAARVRSGTFHAVAHALLRGHAPPYHIVDEEEKLLLLDQAVRHVFFDMEEQTQGAYRYSDQDRETTVRSMHGVFNALEGAPRPPPSGLQGRVLQRYESFKARDGGWDFRDLLVGWRDYIRSPRWPRGAFRHVLIDEVQDLNPLQLEILDALHADGAQLVAIGDDAQAIYGFRGSRVDAILDFERRYAPAAQRVLRRNYRNPPAAVALAQAVIAQNTRRVKRTITSMADPAGTLIEPMPDTTIRTRWRCWWRRVRAQAARPPRRSSCWATRAATWTARRRRWPPPAWPARART